jgi:hypothetical protein
MARKTTPAKADDATEQTTPEATPAKPATPRRSRKAATPTPAEATTPATEKKETPVSEDTTPAEAPEAETPKTVKMNIDGIGEVEIPADTILKAAKEITPTKAGTRPSRPALPEENWKIDPKYRRYSEAITYVADLKDPEAQAGLMTEPVHLAPGLALEWAAVCETHSESQLHRSKGAATYAAADSMLWCTHCMDNVAKYAKRTQEAVEKAEAETDEE